jgi:hypothetical protein
VERGQIFDPDEVAGWDDQRVVDLSDDQPVLPDPPSGLDRHRDDTDEGWGEGRRDNDDRLFDDRPPHWD